MSPKLLTPEAILGNNEIFLIYGEPKTGKTELALTAPGPVYILCIGPENELKTRYSRHFIERENGIHNQKEYYFESVREEYGKDGSITDNPKGFDLACTAIDRMLEAVRKGEMPNPATIIIDNATILEEYMMNKAMVAGYNLSNNTEKSALSRMREYGIIKPADSDWGGAQSLMAKFIAFVFSLPYHIVFVAHEYKEYAQTKNSGSREKKLIGIYPLFVGQQRTHMTRAFDNVWRTTVSGSGDSQRFSIQVVGDDEVVAGSRVGGVLCDSRNNSINNFSISVAIEKFKKYPKEMLAAQDAKYIASQNVRDSVKAVKESNR